MVRAATQVHCELGPVLVNRTAVYKMCRAVPGELRSRGFRVTCSALLARLDADGGAPRRAVDRRLFAYSQRWLSWAVHHPERFLKTRKLSAWLPRRLHTGDVRLFLDSLYALFYGVPDNSVVIIYDVTAVTQPDWHPGGVGRLYAEAFARIAQSRCHIVTCSRHTAAELRLHWGIASSRLTVLPLGLFDFPEPTILRGSSTEAPFFLFVGTLEARKNVAGLIHAFVQSGLYQSRGIRLRLIGMAPEHNQGIAELAKTTPGVDWPGFVSDAELAEAYARCLAFVYPSFCEGFGLPLLEAMSRGCVCLSTITGASPEVAGDTAYYVDPHDQAEIARALQRLAALSPSERDRIGDRARQRARVFTWTRFYDGLAEVLRIHALKPKREPKPDLERLNYDGAPRTQAVWPVGTQTASRC